MFACIQLWLLLFLQPVFATLEKLLLLTRDTGDAIAGLLLSPYLDWDDELGDDREDLGPTRLQVDA
jgi:hypothetical protein